MVSQKQFATVLRRAACGSATSKEAGVTTLFSEDMESGTDYNGLKIANPSLEHSQVQQYLKYPACSVISPRSWTSDQEPFLFCHASQFVRVCPR